MTPICKQSYKELHSSISNIITRFPLGSVLAVQWEILLYGQLIVWVVFLFKKVS